MDIELGLHFPKGYIAHPYWVEREKVINITKQSGTNRARSEGNRIKALNDYLLYIGMSVEQYQKLVAKADRQFYRQPTLRKSAWASFRQGITIRMRL